MNQGISIRNLVSEVLRELERLNYSEDTRSAYQSLYNRFIKFADNAGEGVYSEELGNRFLRANYSYDLDSYTTSLHRSFRN